MLLGLASRKLGAYLPDFLREYAGDTLWALLVFWLIGFLFTRKPSQWVANMALGFSFSIEVSQLYHTIWLDQLRDTTLGSLMLGHGFLWSDLACYACGIGLGYALEKLLNVSRAANQQEFVEIKETVS
ncbi:ribosomal maturation YjgA family protein [Hymenobacter cavernae]|uniref:DUF2809 domain-containing protein n=1 Tax=Hymenobacter cavernae TaxID=2044852 RepID=A0ABQ1TKG6_9BACT|nr:DUF2809 domain-containing protein [Hymenobacter cavernae]GGE95545.1 hypothetical protein GCM10011383_02840 [Hymenobacter cavernae]